VRLDTTRPGYVVLFAGAVSATFTAGIMALHVATAGRVRRNEKLFEARAKVEVFGLGEPQSMSDEAIIEAAESRIATRRITDPRTGRELELLEAYDRPADEPGARLIARGFAVSGVGFWARIDGIVALKPDFSEILGVAFLRHAETPGLGGRITEPQWRRRFHGLKATPPERGEKFIHIGGPAPAGEGDPRFGRHVDAITGATGTSSAVERFLNEHLGRFRRAAEAAGLLGRGVTTTRTGGA